MTTERSSVIACEHASRCAGCPLISLTYGDQLDQKTEDVRRALARYADLFHVRVLAALGAEPVTGYRTRAKLVAGPGGSLGLYEKGGGHIVLDIPGCRVISPALALAANTIRARLQDSSKPGEELSLRAVDLREARSSSDARPRVLVTLVVERGPAFRLERIRDVARDLARETPSIVGVAVNFHDGKSPRILGSETVLVHGDAEIQDRLGASTHQATFGAFAQAHRNQAGRVHELVVDALFAAPRPGLRPPRVIDLYGGSGAVALALAARGAEVALVESFEPAVVRAKEAAAEQGIQLETVAASAASAIASFLRQNRVFDAVVVNPPRRGVDPETRQALGSLKPALVAYISCDPVTLARDLAHFARLGFVASEAQPLDMIPLTAHTETVVVLRRGAPPPPARLFEDDDVLAVAKSPHEPTTPQGEHASSLLDRVRSLPGLGAAVPIHRLDIGTSGVVFFAKDPSKVHAFSQALGHDSADKTYLALVRGGAPKEGTIDRPLHEEKRTVSATTHWKSVESLGGHTLLEVRPEQGRTHQIRRHLAAIRHPVLGDARYGHAPSNRYFEEKYGLDRTFLHAARMTLVHPKTGKKLVVEAPLAGDLEGVLVRLRLADPAGDESGYDEGV
jgi:23S rRNA (uracil1939-C5)-methyltransferase